MNPAANRDTFLSCADFLAQSAGHCFRAERALSHALDQADTPYCLALQKLAEKEHRLGRELERYAQDAPDELRCTRLQYTLAPDDTLNTDTPGGAVKGIEQMNASITDTLELAETKISAPVAEQYLAPLRGEVDTINREISRIRSSMREL